MRPSRLRAGAGVETGSITIPLQDTVYGVLKVPLQDRVYAAGSITIPLEDNVVYPSGVITIPLEDNVYEIGSITIPLEDRVNALTTGRIWKATVILDGVDMSARLTGRLSVDGVASKAQTAGFSLLPFSGAIDPYAWVDAPVSIDYETYDGSGTRLTLDRLFTGYVDEPIYDPASGITEFVCTDGLQTQTEAKTRAQIDAVIGGYHSEAVFGELDSLWDYALQRLKTVPADYDLDRYGQERLTPWEAKAVADLTFDESSIIHRSLGLSLSRRRDLVNAIDIEVGYRYGRKWQREVQAGWHYPRPFVEYLDDSTTLPNKEMVLGALDTGWIINSISWTKMPPNDQYVLPGGSQTTWFLSDDMRDYLVWGVSFTAALRWLQDVTETYTVQVRSDASIARHGKVSESASYVVDLEIDEDYEEPPVETDLRLTYTSEGAETASAFGYQAPELGGQPVNDRDIIIDPDDRSDYENAMLTAIAKANTEIRASHRRNVVSFQTLLTPAMDRALTGETDTSRIAAQGKVNRVLHEMDIDAGEAITTVELVLTLPNVSGQVDSGIVLPTNVDTQPVIDPGEVQLGNHFGGRTTTPYNPDWQGYIGNWQTREFPSEWYPEEFRIDMPEVPEAARDAAEFDASQVLNVALDQDPLTINA